MLVARSGEQVLARLAAEVRWGVEREATLATRFDGLLALGGGHVAVVVHGGWMEDRTPLRFVRNYERVVRHCEGVCSEARRRSRSAVSEPHSASLRALLQTGCA